MGVGRRKPGRTYGAAGLPTLWTICERGLTLALIWGGTICLTGILATLGIFLLIRYITSSFVPIYYWQHPTPMYSQVLVSVWADWFLGGLVF